MKKSSGSKKSGGKSKDMPKSMSPMDHRKMANMHRAKGRMHEAKADLMDAQNPPKSPKGVMPY